MAYRQRLTDLGRDAIAKGQTGLLLTFTRIVLGEGESDFEDIPEMTELVAPVMIAPIVAVARTALGQVTITTKIPLNSIPQEFWLHEIGVFATVGSEPEVLYAVSVSDQFPTSISPEMPGGSTNEHTIKIAVVIGTTENVTAVFDPEIEVINIGAPSVGAGFFSNRIGNEFRFKRLAVSPPLSISEDQSVVRVQIPNPIVPVGGMIPFAGVTIPEGWLLCNGGWYSKAQFPALAAAIGNTYGGDANSFAVPNCNNRTLIGVSANRGLGSVGGEEAHTLTVAELAYHGHSIYDPGHAHPIWIGEHGHNYADPLHSHFEGLHYHNIDGRPIGAAGNQINIPDGYGGNIASSTRWSYSDIQAAAIGIVIQPNVVPAAVQHAFPTQYGMAISANGGNAPHNNMQPYLTINYIIRT